MVELAARHGYDMEGNSIPTSEAEDDETEDSYGRRGPESRDETSSEYHGKETDGSGGSGKSEGKGGGAGTQSPSGRAHRHGGMSFSTMRQIFEALVNIQIF